MSRCKTEEKSTKKTKIDKKSTITRLYTFFQNFKKIRQLFEKKVNSKKRNLLKK